MYFFMNLNLSICYYYLYSYYMNIFTQCHVIGHLIELPHFKHVRGTDCRARLNCRVCGKKSSAYCVTCSVDPPTGKAYADPANLFPICNPTVGRSCFLDHCSHNYNF